jgi:hypothetical protein
LRRDAGEQSQNGKPGGEDILSWPHSIYLLLRSFEGP